MAHQPVRWAFAENALPRMSLLSKAHNRLRWPQASVKCACPPSGIGGAMIYLIDRFEDGLSIYDVDFEYLDGVDVHPEGCGFNIIDHLTHNVYKGRMDYCALL